MITPMPSTPLRGPREKKKKRIELDSRKKRRRIRFPPTLKVTCPANIHFMWVSRRGDR
jgi:hypothetical protein